MGLCCPTGRTEIPISSDSNNNHYTQIIIEAPCPYPPPPRFGRSATLPPNVVIVPILGNPLVDIATLYDLESELGRGQFGITYLGTEKGTGLKYACKAIPRRKLVATKDIESAKREIMILQHLTGQLVELKGAYEDRKTLYLVTEVCSGGELFDRIFIC